MIPLLYIGKVITIFTYLVNGIKDFHQKYTYSS